MEHMDAMVDLVRALSKKCEGFEDHKHNAAMYHRWYNEEQNKVEKLNAEVDRLIEILQNAGIEY